MCHGCESKHVGLQPFWWILECLPAFSVATGSGCRSGEPCSHLLPCWLPLCTCGGLPCMCGLVLCDERGSKGWGRGQCSTQSWARCHKSPGVARFSLLQATRHGPAPHPAGAPCTHLPGLVEPCVARPQHYTLTTHNTPGCCIAPHQLWLACCVMLQASQAENSPTTKQDNPKREEQITEPQQGPHEQHRAG